VIVVVLLVGGVLAGVAIGQIDGDQYTGCLNSGGQIKNVAIGDEPLMPCKSNEAQISWNETGPPGADGPQGIQGEPGPPASFYYVGDSGSVDPGATETLTMECDEGDLAISSGPNMSNSTSFGGPAEVTVTQSQPLGFVTAVLSHLWSDVYQNDSATDSYNIFSVATCADLTP